MHVNIANVASSIFYLSYDRTGGVKGGVLCELCEGIDN